jgi:hypothetical protein
MQCGDRLPASSAGSGGAAAAAQQGADLGAVHLRPGTGGEQDPALRGGWCAARDGRQRGHVVPAGQVGVDPCGGRSPTSSEWRSDG